MEIKTNIPIININELDKLEDVLEKLSPSKIIQDRNRPYNGQPWTDDGIRGKTFVTGLTMRDIKDCFRIALFESCEHNEEVKSIYDLDIGKCDPVAIEQNLTCNIEKMMGIYPNICKYEI